MSSASAPRVSVLIPLYNKQDYIERCLESVLAQSFTDFEVLVVDDGSEDRGPERVLKLTDPRIRLIRQRNAGPGAARNRGMRESRGEWLAPLDADDAWKPELLTTLLGHADAHPECDVVVCAWYKHVRDPDHVRRRFRQLGMQEGPYRLEPGLGPVDMRRMLSRFGSRNTLVRRDVALGLGGFHETARNGEDHYLWIRLLLNCTVYLSDEVLAFQDPEAAELSAAKRQARVWPPPRPIVADPEPIRRVCPDEYRETLERFLCEWGRREWWQQLKAGRPEEATRIVSIHPASVHGALDRLRMHLWLWCARRQRGIRAGRWKGIAGFVYNRLPFLRPNIARR